MNDFRLPGPRVARPALLLGTIVAAAVVLALAAHATPAHAAEPPPCQATLTKVGGKRVLENCGPATVTLKYGGQTYHYTKGFCSDSKSAGADLDLDLGTLVAGSKGNGGEPYFSMLIAKIGGSVFEADFGGKQLFGDTLIKSSGTMKGTFTSTNVGAGEEFSGSWNCHGVIWHAP